MKDSRENNELFRSSHMMIIITYTILSVMLIIETYIMDWERWAVVVIAGGVIATWYFHFSGIGNDLLRLWICSILIMTTFFYYGCHETSLFDLAIVMSVVMILYTMTGVHSLITLCQVTFYLTFVYEMIIMYAAGTRPDALIVTRSILHIAIITVMGWICRTIIDKWSEVLDQSREEVSALNESVKRINDFIANVSHEIRTPINAILGICNMAIADETEERKIDKLLSIEEAGKKIGEQISDILDYSEIDRNDLANNCEDYMLSSLLNDVVNELTPYRKKELELVIDVDASIPSVMNSDAAKIKKILWHTIVNGLKYTNEGGVYVHLSPVPHDYGINLCIEVKDTGIGMDERQLEMIYDSFYKADSGRDRMTGGLGLGMRIVHGFVRSLGGFMTIESAVSEGTTIRISIPNKVVDEAGCMSVRDRDKISLGAYLHFEKYPDPNVREFYDSMVRNIVTGLKVTMHRVDNVESLHALIESKKLTHLFAGPEEYNDNVEYMEELAKTIIVTVVANPEELCVPSGSRVRIMPKPFYCFPVVGILNSKATDEIAEEGKVTFPGARILVVDDEPMNLIVSSAMLARYNMIVTTCESGQEAIDICRDNEFDIIFMDHMMPGMDGVEAMKRIRSNMARGKIAVPVIAFTANAVSSAKEMFRREGFDGFISKPVDRIEMERVLRRLLPANLISVERPDDAKKEEGEKGLKRPANPVGMSLFDRLSSIGVDTEKGLYYCQNDEDFYKTLLMQYRKESSDKKHMMKEALEHDDMAAYAIQAHSIKSTSKMIGATDLSDTARLLEQAAKSGDRDYVTANHDAMIAMYERVLETLADGEDANLDETGRQDGDVLEFEPNDPEGGVV